MREFLNKYGSYVALVVLLLAAAVWWFFFHAPREPNLSKAFFVDEDTGEEQILELNEYPPRINPKTGKPTLVQEIKYSCDGRKTVRIAYYLKYSDGLKRQLERAFKEHGKPGGVDVSNGSFVRASQKGSPWLSSGSADAGPVQQIICPSGDDIEMVLPP